jgi:hypothetical protein
MPDPQRDELNAKTTFVNTVSQYRITSALTASFQVAVGVHSGSACPIEEVVEISRVDGSIACCPIANKQSSSKWPHLTQAAQLSQKTLLSSHVDR